jgi:tRNA modification GTPase
VKAGLLAAKKALADQIEPEFLALELRETAEALGEVTGRVDIEDILDVVFSRFCIGK